MNKKVNNKEAWSKGRQRRLAFASPPVVAQTRCKGCPEKKGFTECDFPEKRRSSVSGKYAAHLFLIFFSALLFAAGQRVGQFVGKLPSVAILTRRDSRQILVSAFPAFRYPVALFSLRKYKVSRNKTTPRGTDQQWTF